MPTNGNSTTDTASQSKLHRLQALLGLAETATPTDVMKQLLEILKTLNLDTSASAMLIVKTAGDLIGQTMPERRQQTIKQASAEYIGGRETQTMICSHKAWIDTALRDANLPALNDEEAHQLCLVD